ELGRAGGQLERDRAADRRDRGSAVDRRDLDRLGRGRRGEGARDDPGGVVVEGVDAADARPVGRRRVDDPQRDRAVAVEAARDDLAEGVLIAGAESYLVDAGLGREAAADDGAVGVEPPAAR